MSINDLEATPETLAMLACLAFGHEVFAVEAYGSQMAPEVLDGDLVLVSPIMNYLRKNPPSGSILLCVVAKEPAGLKTGKADAIRFLRFNESDETGTCGQEVYPTNCFVAVGVVTGKLEAVSRQNS